MHFLRLLLLAALALPARTVSIRLLVTTDLHGNIYPYDYFTTETVNRGLAKLATLIQAERKEFPSALLIDCGDTIQGTPLESAYQLAFAAGKTSLPDPMMAAMNALSFDAMTLGNHELNFGLRNLAAARSHARFPWLSANTRLSPGSAAKPFAPYIVKEIDGVRVAIVGITTPSIPLWEKPENYKGYRFLGGEDAAREAVKAAREKDKADVVVIASHAGLDRDLRTGKTFPNIVPGENMVWNIATGVSGVDAVVFGHTHRTLVNQSIGDVALLQPQNWGGSLGRLDITVEGAPGAWKVTGKRGMLIPVRPDTPADPAILALAKPYHDAAEKELMVPVAASPVDMDGAFARDADTALIDAIQEVQLHYAKAEVSFAAAFNLNMRIRKGPMTVRELSALYVYDNELYAIEGDGRMVKDALENAARYYAPCPAEGCKGKPRTNSAVIGFNYDMAQGVEYEIDPARPEGDRVRNLRYQGRPLAMDRKLRIAVNNYRYGGSAGYGMFSGAKILWQSNQPIRDLMVEYYTRKKTLPSAADGNWRVVLR
ncbi:MAG: hypothetical protein FJW30_09175 [Acidobacteria bacterium]|nr:hypothetical protein [Acidobacteriota bacterium]